MTQLLGFFTRANDYIKLHIKSYKATAHTNSYSVAELQSNAAPTINSTTNLAQHLSDTSSDVPLEMSVFFQL